jgi:hypothetical protein
VASNLGAKPCFFRSLRISRSAAPGVTAALNQNVEDLALVIDGPRTKRNRGESRLLMAEAGGTRRDWDSKRSAP